MTDPRARRALATAATLVVALASTAGCTHSVVGSVAHRLEPGLGANFGVTNHTGQTLHVQVRAVSPNESGKPFNSFQLDCTMTLDPGATILLPDVNLAANTCTNKAMVAYAGTHAIARSPSPLCVNSKAQGGWTITTP